MAVTDVPPVSHAAWSKIVTGGIKVDVEFLAARIFLPRAMASAQRDASQPNIKRLVWELREIYVKNAHLPMVKKDIAKFFS